MKDKVLPTVTTQNERTVYTHPAFGVIELTHPTGGHQHMFGSDVGASHDVIKLTVSTAELHRELSRDWIFGNKLLIELEMTHAQFAQFISSSGRSDATPVTLKYASLAGLPDNIPHIDKIETKADIFNTEIEKNAKNVLSSINYQISKLEALVESGKIPIKELRNILKSLKIGVENAPVNMGFVVKQAREALENASSAAKIEVEAFIDARARSLGFSQIKEMSAALTQNDIRGLILDDSTYEEDEWSLEGWHCKTSPTQHCEYPDNMDGCVHCGKPSERK
jgi:hypothetical protein